MSTALNTVTLRQELPDQSQLREFADLALNEARRLGADAASVALGSGVGLNVNVRNRELESVEFQRDNDLGITVYFGQCRGQASSADLNSASIREVVAAACTIARHTQPDPYAGLPEAELLASNPRDLELDHPADLSVAQATELATICEAAALDADPRISNSEGANVSSHRGIDYIANSLGFRGAQATTDYSISAAVIAGSGEGMQRDYWYERGRQADIFSSGASVGQRAAQRAVARLDSRRLSTRKAAVLLPPEHARGFIGHLLSAASGGALYRRSSFLLDRLDTQVGATLLNIRQMPWIPGAYGAGWFDSEGVATREYELVRGGILASYILGSYSGRKLGLPSTGNAGGIRTLEVAPTAGDLDSLMQQAGSGLLITELMGQGVNASTGDYSRGAAGIWFEDGSAAFPVQGITIGGNLLDLYANILAIGNDIDQRGVVRCGSILVDGLTIAGE